MKLISAITCLMATAAAVALSAAPALARDAEAGRHSAARAPAADNGNLVAYQGLRDSGWDIFSAGFGPGDPQAWIKGRVSVDRQRLTSGPGNEVQPAISPNGRKIVFVREGAGRDSELMMMNADGSDVESLTSNAAADRQPAFSRDGRRIAFSSDRSGNFDIWTIRTDGTQPRRVSAEQGPAANPVFSFFGGSIFYEGPSVSDPPNGRDAILSVDSNSPPPAQPREILAFRDGQRSNGFSMNPGYSGRVAVSVGERNGVSGWKYNLLVGRCAEGCRDPRETWPALSFVEPYATNPDLSPKGDWIAFQRDRQARGSEQGTSQIYLMFGPRPGGSETFVQPLTDRGERNANPDWGSP